MHDWEISKLQIKARGLVNQNLWSDGKPAVRIGAWGWLADCLMKAKEIE